LASFGLAEAAPRVKRRRRRPRKARRLAQRRWHSDRHRLTYVRDVETPLLLIHAEDDLRCPNDQAEQLFTALRKLRRDVTFVRFPCESHTFSATGRPRHHLERPHIILDWFRRKLTATSA
jgi:dipeptidyl aminopeptidase/acylaminoacyl peptidase